jgi:DNA-binding transcriptional LysR family regulator
MPPDLDLRSIRCLVVLSEERHYARAADRLNMSQPGLSRVISTLEQRLGATLVLRGFRPVTFTRCGSMLLDHGRELLRQQELAFDALAHVGLGRPELRISAHAPVVVAHATPARPVRRGSSIAMASCPIRTSHT